MNILILLGDVSKPLCLFSRALVSSIPFPASIQVIPARDTSTQEWNWANSVIIGVSYSNAASIVELETFLASLGVGIFAGKGLAIFQLQARWDAPISAAYGYGLARRLRQHGMALLAPPIVFFRASDTESEMEGELLRASRWLAHTARRLIRTSPKD